MVVVPLVSLANDFLGGCGLVVVFGVLEGTEVETCLDRGINKRIRLHVSWKWFCCCSLSSKQKRGDLLNAFFVIFPLWSKQGTS